MASRLIALLAFSLALVSPRLVSADEIRAVVRRSPGSEAAQKRLRGQLVDVEVEIIEVKGKLEPSIDEQVIAAGELAAQHGARAVLWFVPREGGLDVIVAQPEEKRVFLRSIRGDDDSANAEAAALAGRSALRAIGEGGVIGVVTPTPEPVKKPPGQARDDESPFVKPIRRPGAWRATGRLGWRLVADGGPPSGVHELVGHVGVGGRTFTLELGLAVGPPSKTVVEDGEDQVDVRLGRATALLGVAFRSGAFGGSLGAGSLIYQRSTAETDEDLTATPPTLTPTFLLAGELRYRLPLTEPAELEISLGVSLALGAPELAVTRGEETRVIQSLWLLQPHIGLGLAFDGF